MKAGESLRTETTKQSLIQVSSNKIAVIQQFVKIFIRVENRTFSIHLPLQSKTIQSLIIDSIKQFNQEFCLDLESTHEDYAVYAARKNGNKCKDYPSFDNSQNILLTNSKFYYLTKKRKQQKTFAYPLTQIKIQNLKNSEKKVKKNAACFCIFL